MPPAASLTSLTARRHEQHAVGGIAVRLGWAGRRRRRGAVECHSSIPAETGRLSSISAQTPGVVAALTNLTYRYFDDGNVQIPRRQRDERLRSFEHDSLVGSRPGGRQRGRRTAARSVEVDYGYDDSAI